MVSELLGHSGIQITGDIYTSVFEEVDRDAAEAVARLVPRAVSGQSSATVCPQRAHTGPPRRSERAAARMEPQVSDSGAGGARTHDRGIMSPLL